MKSQDIYKFKMNIPYKNVLTIAAGFALLAIGYAALSFTNAYSRSIQPSSFRSFAVSGEGKVVVVPDVAQFSFSVITQGGNDLASLQKQNTEKANAAIDFLKGEGVDEEDIKTQQYSVDPRYQRFNCNPVIRNGATTEICPPPEIVGYTVTQSVQVKLRDFSKIGGVMAGVVENGANQVSNLDFTLDDPSSAENDARKEAIEEAKRKAEAVAQAGGFRLGRLLSIEEGFVGPYYNQTLGRGGALDFATESTALPAPSIEPGSQDVEINVVLRYEIN